MDHNESVRKFEHLMIREADHAHEAATELEALISLLPSEKSRQLAQLQVKASHKQAKEFRELAQQAREKYSRAHSFLAINRLYDWYQRSGTPKSFDGI